MKTFLRIATLAAITLAPIEASAFVLDLNSAGNALHWAIGGGGSVGYRIKSNNVPFGSQGEQAIHNAFAAWNGASSNIDYRFDGYTNAGMANDGKNTVLFIYDNWPYDPGFAALTFRYYDNSSGKLLDTDIAFNAARYAWSIGGSDFDIENSATHEVGHFGGLGHSNVGEATMYSRTMPGETSKRSLASDDVAGLQAIYGGSGSTNAGGGSSTPSNEPSDGISGGGGGGGGGCTTGAGAGDALFAGMVSLGFAIRQLRRRAR